jgi:hypothetical protein
MFLPQLVHHSISVVHQLIPHTQLLYNIMTSQNCMRNSVNHNMLQFQIQYTDSVRFPGTTLHAKIPGGTGSQEPNLQCQLKKNTLKHP